ncbi:MAG: energy transducer TonB [Ignavibacteria bacterium]|jgi:protein TonB
MEEKRSNKISFFISLAIHLIVVSIFTLINITIEADEAEFVTLGFGTYGKVSSSGAKSEKKEEEDNIPKKVQEKKEEQKEKEVDLPAAVNTDDDNVIAEKEKKEKVEPEPEKVKPLLTDEDESSKGKENVGEGEGNFGFEIDFGGKGIRKIYSYSLPAYPEGVSKEIDVKLKFSILPDGSVSKIFPLIKADTRLEMAAINSLRQWRFEPLSPIQKQVEQTAVIIFPYRLQ